MAYAIYQGSMGIRSKEVVREGFATMEDALAAFHEMFGDKVAHIEEDYEGHEAYDALVARGHLIETYAIEKAVH